MSVSYTLRMPDDLKRLCDSAAKSGGVSTAQLIVDACWKYLERDSSGVERRGAIVTRVEGSIPSPASAKHAAINDNAAMQAFLAKLPANTPIEPEQPPLLRPCPKIGWDHPDGDPRKCRLQAGHKGNCSPGEKVDA